MLVVMCRKNAKANAVLFGLSKFRRYTILKQLRDIALM